MVGRRSFSFWDCFLASAMLVSGSVSYIDRVKIDWHSSQGIFFVIEANVLSLTFWGLAVYRLPNIKAMDFFSTVSDVSGLRHHQVLLGPKRKIPMVQWKMTPSWSRKRHLGLEPMILWAKMIGCAKSSLNHRYKKDITNEGSFLLKCPSFLVSIPIDYRQSFDFL